MMVYRFQTYIVFYFSLLLLIIIKTDDIIGCGGFVKSNVEINFDLVKVKLYTKQGILKYESDCAPTNGYYMVPVYDIGEYYLKVECPLGWTFVPNVVELNIDWKTDKCSLEEDINFVFSGFGIAGKVISFGQTTGPKGVNLSLNDLIGDNEVASTVTTEDGLFSFEKILPGQYQIQASHPVWTFKNKESFVLVDQKTVKIDSEIIVAGYDTSGKILSDKQPVQGVNFFLYSKSITQEHVENCNIKFMKEDPILENSKFLCFVTSTSSGTFTFPVLPTGEYTLVPVYKTEKVKYEVIPNKIYFTIKHDSFVLQEPFQISGFVVSGKVLTSLKGVGIEGAGIILNGNPLSVSNSKGEYTLDGMKSGTYKVKVEKDGYMFRSIEAEINPSEPLLPDIYPIKYKVCGKIILDELQEKSLKDVKFMINFETTEGRIVSTISLKPDKSFCEYLSPLEYIVKVDMGSKDSQIYLLPSAQQIQVADHPINDIFFTQMQAKISGTIFCLERCGTINLLMKSLDGPHDKGKIIKTSSNGKINEFVQEIYIGNYKVSILNEKWCWEQDTLGIQIKNESDIKINFKQTGFKMSIQMSHEAILTIKDETSIESEQLKAVKGVNVFCLANNKIYEIAPKSCHKFEHEVYYHDVNSDWPLTISLISYLVKVEASTNEKNSQISATIKDSADSTEIILDKLTFVSTKKNGNTTRYFYEASFFMSESSHMSIKLNSETLLFEPETKDISILSDSCPAIVATFEGLKGIFIEGLIKPPIDNVEIHLEIEGSGQLRSTSTDSLGKYKIGPLKSSMEYSLLASKLGYRFVMDDVDKNIFVAYKLAEIIVEVSNIDLTHEKLSGVLISLSGSKFRKNNLTSENGVISFMDLAPGQYYLKLMMKEYDFQPSTKVIEISEGQVLDIKILAKRVAFSIYCFVTSLNGEAESGLVVEAKGLGLSHICGQLQEEAKTELDGSVRIRGLKPGCEYEVMLKNSSEFDNIYERVTPVSKKIQISDSDVFGITFIVFRRFTHADLSGRINSKHEYLDTIKVQLFLDTNPDDAIQNQAITVSPFFYFNSIPIDKQWYTLKIISTLSRRDYEYTFQEIHFKSESAVQHFVIHFDPQTKPNGEHELSQASILMLPFTLLVLYLFYNNKMVIPFARKKFNEYISTVSKSALQTQTPPRLSSLEFNLPADLLDPLTKKRKKLTKI